MKILVTGGAGFIGSNIVDLLIKLGHEVVIIDNLSTGNIGNVNTNAKLYVEDILDITTKNIINSFLPDVVIHTAAQIDVQRSIVEPDFDMDVNIKGTLNLLNCCKQAGVKKIIYSSSAAIYGTPEYLPIDENHKLEPISFYGVSKLTPEYYIKIYKDLYNIDYVILRYSNVYGIRQDSKGEGGVVSIFLNRIIKNQDIDIYGDGYQTRDFIYVEDIANANIKALEYYGCGIFNISTGNEVTINELYNIIKNITKTEVKSKYKAERPGDIKYSYLDNTKAKKYLNWTYRYDIKKGLEKTINYYLNKK